MYELRGFNWMDLKKKSITLHKNSNHYRSSPSTEKALQKFIRPKKTDYNILNEDNIPL